jgi:hypothetical protein
MTWESRPDSGGRYYARSRRIDGRRVHEYVGAGWAGELAAAEDAMRREARERALMVRRTERERLAELDAPLEALDAQADVLYRAVLVLSGYRQHARGQWRKRRRGNDG